MSFFVFITANFKFSASIVVHLDVEEARMSHALYTPDIPWCCSDVHISVDNPSASVFRLSLLRRAVLHVTARHYRRHYHTNHYAIV